MPTPISVLVILRDKVGLTQEGLAKVLGVTPQTIHNWEAGKSQPRLTIRKTKKLCQALKTPLNDMPNSFAPAEGLDPPGKRRRSKQLNITEL